MKRRILVADDEPAILEVLRSALERKEYEVETASSGAEALQKLHAAIFHLVITDMKMETDSAGFAVMEGARLQPYKPAVVLFTAYPSLGKDWLESGGDAMFIKGTGIQDILDGIKDLLDHLLTSAAKQVR